VAKGLTVLERLAHRGASGAEEATGDGSGILVQVPDRFLRDIADDAGFALPAAGHYATGMTFLPQDPDDAAKARAQIASVAAEEGLDVLGWREVPVEGSGLGASAQRAQPRIEQVFLAAAPRVTIADPLHLDRLAYVVRKRAEHLVTDCYFPSLSARTLVYKGMLTAHQVSEFYPELSDPRLESALALVHSRFSTNTFPSWPLAHPYRYLAHNGEINTVAGNRNWMRAREALLATDALPGQIERILPICTPGASDSASFDEVLELLHLGGRTLPHAVLMMIPRPGRTTPRWTSAGATSTATTPPSWSPGTGPPQWRSPMAPSSGGPRPQRPAPRPLLGDQHRAGGAGERGRRARSRAFDRRAQGPPPAGADVPGGHGQGQDRRRRRDQVGPRLRTSVRTMADPPADQARAAADARHADPQHASVVTHQRLFGYTQEELRIILAPMARTGAEPIGSMGSDTAIAVLSDRSRLVYDYFTSSSPR